MSQTKPDPQTEAAWKQYQENVKKSREYHQEQRLKQAEAKAPKPEPSPVPSAEKKPQQPTKMVTDEQVKNILENFDIHQPARTWTTSINSQNMTPFYNMVTQLSDYLSKPIWQKFTEEPLKINPYFLTPEQLIEKNKAIIESRKGTFLFRELVSTFYLKSLPEDFKTKFQARLDNQENIVKGFFGWCIFGLTYIKINKKKNWSWVSRINHVWAKSFALIAGSTLGIYKYWEFSDSSFARENVEIVETCVDTHLRLIAAHGVNLDQTLKKFEAKEKAN